MKLTQANAAKAKLPAGKSEAFYWDDEMPGFGLRLREGGARTFIVQYKIGAKHRRMTLGNAGKVTAEEARKRAKQIFGKVADGKDPANEKTIRKAEASTTLGAAVETFLRWFAGRVRPRTHEETARYLRQHWKPLHGMAVAHIGRANVAAEASAIAQKSGPVAADRARSALSTFFAWAMGEGLRDDNPVIGTNKAAPASNRERVLSDAETVLIWNAADPATDYGKIVRLLFTTACRREEIGGLKPGEIALGDSLIALPGDRTKNGLPHDVPLSGLAKATVESLELDRRMWAFGRRDSGFSGWSKAKAEMDRALPNINQPWTLHDIRRTVATRMGDLGVQPHIVEAVLNHISGSKRGVAGTYNRSTYAKEKKAALDNWASHLQTLIAGAGNVRRLSRA
jgi:integrase